MILYVWEQQAYFFFSFLFLEGHHDYLMCIFSDMTGFQSPFGDYQDVILWNNVTRNIASLLMLYRNFCEAVGMNSN